MKRNIEKLIEDYSYEELIELYRNYYAILPTKLREELHTYEIYEESVKSRSLNLQHVPEKFCTKELCELAVNKNGFVIQYVPKHLLTEELCITAVINDGVYLLLVPIEFRTEELCNLAVKTCPEAEQFAPKGTSAYNNYMMKKALL